MSTKMTMAYNKEGEASDFHLYQECYDEDGSVYLELSGDVEFYAHPNQVVVRIPGVVWEEIIKSKRYNDGNAQAAPKTATVLHLFRESKTDE